MRYLLPFFASAFFAFTEKPILAAFVWCVSIAGLHAYQEADGELWAYFRDRTDAQWLTSSNGVFIIVLPALALQLFAAWQAFVGDKIAPFWLALLIGARLGDAMFSHAIPYAEDGKPNPGLPSAVLYAADALLLLIAFHVPLFAHGDSLRGFLIGAGLFAFVQPGLRLSARLF